MLGMYVHTCAGTVRVYIRMYCMYICMYVCMYVRTCVKLSSQQTVRFPTLVVQSSPCCMCLQTMGFVEQLLEYQDVMGRCLAKSNRCE